MLLASGGGGGGFFPARWLMGHWSPGRRSQESLWQQLAPLPHKAPPQGDGGQLAWQPCSGQRHFVAETTMLSQNSRGVQRRLGTPALTVKTGEIAGSPPSVFERLDTGGSPQVHRERRVSYLQLRGAPFITNQQQVALAVHNNLLLEPAPCEGRPWSEHRPQSQQHRSQHPAASQSPPPPRPRTAHGTRLGLVLEGRAGRDTDQHPPPSPPPHGQCPTGEPCQEVPAPMGKQHKPLQGPCA